MKILHVADTHLGYSAYRKATDDGINRREMDVYNAFEQFVDYAVDIKPDIIIHAGDLFDNVRPNNRAISFAVDQLNRLSKKQIPTVLIAGNHEHPKLRETGHIFKVFDHIEKVCRREGYEGQLLERLPDRVVGHQIGVEVHEDPWLKPGQNQIFVDGMVFCIEPKLWHKGEYYLRVEDMILIENGRALSLTNYDRELFQL